MANQQIFLLALLWVVFWGAIGSLFTPRIYSRKDLDISRATLGGALVGAALGPIGLIPLWIYTPRFTNRIYAVASIIVLGILILAFARAYPDNLCVSDGGFVASQVTNGIVIGLIYSLMALGLTLIYSILGIVSFAHGEFYMVGGMVVYFMSASTLFGRAGAWVWLLGAAVVTFVIGAIFEILFLRPMGEGKIERPKEYAILVTFGLSFFLQYLVQGLAGANPVKAPRFFDFPVIELPNAEDPYLIKTTAGNLRLFDAVSIPNTRFVSAMISVLLLFALLFFLYRTWTGRGLRAVSEDRQAASVAGINPYRMNTLAFALGGMLAGLSGATLVQVFTWLPQVGIPAAARSFVIIVLGGMGSLPGAFVGGIIVGLVEALGAGCVPDPARAAAYIPAYGMIILTLTLLLKPTGLFGREL
ncbi:MAG: branched-chain amino acid ABC transporter permease [Caldilineaceae bacterium]|nr:branched-chain amino acid ABC transporter permease [Caldilineaceae bacterium]